MTDSTAAEGVNTFNGGFELRDWKEPRRIETPSGAIAWDLGGALVSCQTAVLTLAIGKPERARPYETRIEGNLRIDPMSFPFTFSLNQPDRASGLLRIREHSLWFELELRRNRITATVFARTTNDLPVEAQVFLFYRVGTKDPARRAPEKAPASLALQKPATQTPISPPATPRIDPAAQLAAEWTLRLRNTQLSHVENDFNLDYGSSTYIERRVMLRLLDRQFSLDRSTFTRVMTPSSPRRSQLTGTWTILAVAGASRVRLQLTSTDGEQLVYVLGEAGADCLLVDGTPWRWSR